MRKKNRFTGSDTHVQIGLSLKRETCASTRVTGGEATGVHEFVIQEGNIDVSGVVKPSSAGSWTEERARVKGPGDVEGENTP